MGTNLISLSLSSIPTHNLAIEAIANNAHRFQALMFDACGSLNGSTATVACKALARMMQAWKLHEDSGIRRLEIALSADFFSWGAEPLGLLLFFGDLKEARTGIAKVNDVHKRILARVRQGVASADG